MEEEKAKYLDEERVKLWQELRGTQERLKIDRRRSVWRC